MLLLLLLLLMLVLLVVVVFERQRGRRGIRASGRRGAVTRLGLITVLVIGSMDGSGGGGGGGVRATLVVRGLIAVVGSAGSGRGRGHIVAHKCARIEVQKVQVGQRDRGGGGGGLVQTAASLD